MSVHCIRRGLSDTLRFTAMHLRLSAAMKYERVSVALNGGQRMNV